MLRHVTEPCCDYRDHGGNVCTCECHDSVLEGSVGYGMWIPDDDAADQGRDNEAFEGWGPGR
jgi:hypothetical protein